MYFSWTSLLSQLVISLTMLVKTIPCSCMASNMNAMSSCCLCTDVSPRRTCHSISIDWPVMLFLFLVIVIFHHYLFIMLAFLFWLESNKTCTAALSMLPNAASRQEWLLTLLNSLKTPKICSEDSVWTWKNCSDFFGSSDKIAWSLRLVPSCRKRCNLSFFLFHIHRQYFQFNAADSVSSGFQLGHGNAIGHAMLNLELRGCGHRTVEPCTTSLRTPGINDFPRLLSIRPILVFKLTTCPGQLVAQFGLHKRNHQKHHRWLTEHDKWLLLGLLVLKPGPHFWLYVLFSPIIGSSFEFLNAFL